MAEPSKNEEHEGPIPEQWRATLAAIVGDVTLVPLPDETWMTSVVTWHGDRWNCLVDLWTAEEGRSDLVLDVDVFEREGGYRFRLHLVYVP